jgi:hypothetical protein
MDSAVCPAMICCLSFEVPASLSIKSLKKAGLMISVMIMMTGEMLGLQYTILFTDYESDKSWAFNTNTLDDLESYTMKMIKIYLYF